MAANWWDGLEPAASSAGASPWWAELEPTPERGWGDVIPDFLQGVGANALDMGAGVVQEANTKTPWDDTYGGATAFRGLESVGGLMGAAKDYLPDAVNEQVEAARAGLALQRAAMPEDSRLSSEFVGEAVDVAKGYAADARDNRSAAAKKTANDMAKAGDAGFFGVLGHVATKIGEGDVTPLGQLTESLIPSMAAGGVAGKILPALGAAPMLTTMAVTEGGGAGAGARDAVMRAPQEVLDADPIYQRLVAEIGDPARARLAMADTAGSVGNLSGTLASAAMLGIGQKLGLNVAENTLLGRVVAGSQRSMPVRMATGGAKEFVGEGSEGASAQLAQNLGAMAGGVQDDLTEGVGAAFAMEGLAGAGSGIVSGVVPPPPAALPPPKTPAEAGSRAADAMLADAKANTRAIDFPSPAEQEAARAAPIDPMQAPAALLPKQPKPVGVVLSPAASSEAAENARLDELLAPIDARAEAESFAASVPMMTTRDIAPAASDPAAEGGADGPRYGRNEKYDVDIELSKDDKGSYTIVETDASGRREKKIEASGSGVYLGRFVLNEDGEFVPPSQINRSSAESRTDKRPYQPKLNERQAIIDLVAEAQFARATGNHVLADALDSQLFDIVSGVSVSTTGATLINGAANGREAPVPVRLDPQGMAPAVPDPAAVGADPAASVAATRSMAPQQAWDAINGQGTVGPRDATQAGEPGGGGIQPGVVETEQPRVAPRIVEAGGVDGRAGIAPDIADSAESLAQNGSAVLKMRTPSEIQSEFQSEIAPDIADSRIAERPPTDWLAEQSVIEHPSAAPIARKPFDAALDGMTAPPLDYVSPPTTAPTRDQVMLDLEQEIGWEERGGRMIREFDTGGLAPEVAGRTTWQPKAAGDGKPSTFWRDRPDASLSADDATRALRKAREGKKLGVREQRFVEYTQQFADFRIEDMQSDAESVSMAPLNEGSEPYTAADPIPFQRRQEVPYDQRNLARLPAVPSDRTRRLARKLAATGGGRNGLSIGEVERRHLPADLVSALAAFESATGTQVVTVKGMPANGVTFREGELFVDVESEVPILTTAAHEWVHQLRADNPTLYNLLASEVRRQGKLAEWQAELTRRAERDGDAPASRDEATEELTADAVADALTDPAFLREFAARKPGVFRRVVDSFLQFLDRVISRFPNTGSSQYMTDVRAFRDTLADVLEQWQTFTTPEQRSAGVDVAFQRVFHGTPHRGIEQEGFKLNKIGTGEGAQAYGHGMYFAGNREVAEYYRKQLSIDGRRIADLADPYKHEPDEYAITKLSQAARSARLNERNGDAYDYEEAARWIEAGRPADFGGQLYAAEIPDDGDLLDWDKPLSEQPPKVREAISKIAGKFSARPPADLTGGRFYQYWLDGATSPSDAQRASHALNEAGIPGLRYLDGASRNVKGGGHNYVIWDENLLTPEAAKIEPQYSRRRDDDTPDAEREFAETERAYGGREAYARARAAGRTKLNYGQWVQVRLPTFKAWFGDWEEASNSALVSAVRDPETGEPLVVYHGTGADITEFKKPPAGKKTSHYLDFGFHFGTTEVADRYSTIAQYGGRSQSDMSRGGQKGDPVIYPVYLSAQNIADITSGNPLPENVKGAFLSLAEDNGMSSRSKYVQLIDVDPINFLAVLQRKAGRKAIKSVFESAGYDGIKYSFYGDSYVVFDPTQIKSATGNIGTFGQRPVTDAEAARVGMTADEANEAQGRGSIMFSRRQSERPFYSAMAESVDRAQGAPKKAGAETWKQWLDGAVRRGEFKQSERDWLGVDAWLDAQGKPVSRDELADFVRANEVQVQDVVLGGPQSESAVDEWLDDSDAYVNENDDGEFYAGYGGSDIGETFSSAESAWAELRNEARRQIGEYQPDEAARAPKYSGYRTPGGPLARDTEILTRDGWKRIDEVAIGDLVMTRRDEDGGLEWQPVEAKPEVYAEKLYHFANQSIDMRVTACHKMVVKRRRRSRQGIFRATAQELWGMAECVAPLTGAWSAEPINTLYGLDAGDVAELVGWYVAEGSAVKKRSGMKSTLSIAQCRENNAEKCARLEALFGRLGIRWNHVASGPAYYLAIRSMPRPLVDLLHAQGSAADKFVPREFFDYPPQIIARLLESLLLGDGCQGKQLGRKPRWTFFSKSKRLADDVQVLALLTGQRAAVRQRPTGLYAVTINSKQWASIDDAKRGIADYNDTAYCVTVQNHAIYVRNRGVAAFTGNSNYRELLLTLPPAGEKSFQFVVMDGGGRAFRFNGADYATEQDARNAENAARKAEYRSSHWDQPNVLAHVRFDERTDSDGKRVLFINEVQSDWGQQGRKEGFGKKTPDMPLVARKEGNEFGEWFAVYTESGNFVRNVTDAASEADAIRAAREYIAEGRSNRSVPDMPFKQTDDWTMLAFKRMARWAVDNGFDRIAWTTGEQAAEMFDLSKQVDSITLRDSDRRIVVRGTQGNIVHSETGVTDDRIAELVGKEVVDKLREASPDSNGVRLVDGNGLKMGGEGMRGFYDRILPAAVNKWAKKFGAKASLQKNGGRVSLPNSASIEKYAGLALDPMDRGMGAAVENDQVLKAVVGALPVDVVNMLAANGLSAEQVARDPQVLGNKLSANAALTVRNGVRSALTQTAALLRAGLDSAYKTGLDGKLLPALRASDLNADVAAGIVFPEFLPVGGSAGNADGDVGLGRAGPGTEPGRGAVALGRGEGATAGLTDFIQWHDKISHRKGDVSMPESWGITITPQMRDAVAEGQPLFSRRRTPATQQPSPQPAADLRDYDFMPPGAKKGIFAQASDDVRDQVVAFQKLLNGRPKSPQTMAARLNDLRAVIFSSIMTRSRALARRNPTAPSLRKLFNLAIVEPGSSQLVTETVDEAITARFANFTNRARIILSGNGLGKMTATQNAQLREAMLGTLKNPPANIRNAARLLRDLMTTQREDMIAAGIDVGEVSDVGYLTRMYDESLILSDEAGFLRAAEEQYRDHEFKREVGASGRNILYASRDNLARFLSSAKHAATTDQRVSRVLSEIRSKIKEYRGTSDLQTVRDIEALVDSIYGAVASDYAKGRAAAFLHGIKTPSVADYFSGASPSGAPITKERVLSGAADTVLAAYMKTDMLDILDTYARVAGRKIEHAKRFGPKGEKLQQLIDAASREGVPKGDLDQAKELMNSALGLKPMAINPDVKSFFDFTHAWGYITLLPKASLSSLMEAVTFTIRTGDLRHTLAPLIQTMRAVTGRKIAGYTSKELADFAQAIGVNGHEAVEEVLMNRLGGDYAMSPIWSRFLGKFFQATFLTPLTRAQRAYGVGAATGFLRTLANQHLAGRRAADTAAHLNELGIADHQAFAEWMVQQGSLPDPRGLYDAGGRPTPRGHDYMVATRRIIDQSIQNPNATHRPAWTNNPAGRAVTGIMSFSYASYENVIKATIKRAARPAEGGGIVETGRAVGSDLPGFIKRFAAPGIAGAVALVLAQTIASTLREVLFNRDRLEDKDPEELAKELFGLGLSRSFGLGSADPLVQYLTGLKYQRSLAETAVGAVPGMFLQNIDNIANLFTERNSASTETAEFRAAQAGYRMVVAPFLNVVLSRLPLIGGPAIIALSDKAVSNNVAEQFGDKPEPRTHLDDKFAVAMESVDKVNDEVKLRLPQLPRDQWADELEKLKREYPEILRGVTLDTYVDNARNQREGKVGPKADRQGRPILKMTEAAQGSVLGELVGYPYYDLHARETKTSAGITDDIKALNAAIRGASKATRQKELMGYVKAAGGSPEQFGLTTPERIAKESQKDAVREWLQEQRRDLKREAIEMIESAGAPQ